MTAVHSHPFKINRWTNLNSAHPDSTSTVYGKMREERRRGREEWEEERKSGRKRGREMGRRGGRGERGESKVIHT